MITHAEALTVAVLAAVVLAAVVIAAAVTLLSGIIPISRRVPPCAAGRAPLPSGAHHLWPGGPVTAPAGSRQDDKQPARAHEPRPGDPPWGSTARSGPGQPRPAAPEEAAPASPGGGPRAPWVTWQDQPGTPRAPARPRVRLPDAQVAVWEAGGYRIHHRDTAPLPAVRPGVFGGYDAWRDQAEVTL